MPTSCPNVELFRGVLISVWLPVNASKPAKGEVMLRMELNEEQRDVERGKKLLDHVMVKGTVFPNPSVFTSTVTSLFPGILCLNNIYLSVTKYMYSQL